MFQSRIIFYVKGCTLNYRMANVHVHTINSEKRVDEYEFPYKASQCPVTRITHDSDDRLVPVNTDVFHRFKFTGLHIPYPVSVIATVRVCSRAQHYVDKTSM